MSEWHTPYGKKEMREIDIGGFRITIHRLHGIDDVWFGSCYAMGVDRKQLNATTMDDAPREFCIYLASLAASWINKISRAEKALGEKASR